MALIEIPFFQMFMFVRVCSLVCKYLYNVYIVNMFEIVVSF